MVPGEHPRVGTGTPRGNRVHVGSWSPRSLPQSVRLLLRTASNDQTLWMALGGVT
jgi:hypothetical protein